MLRSVTQTGNESRRDGFGVTMATSIRLNKVVLMYLKASDEVLNSTSSLSHLYDPEEAQGK